MHKPELSIIIPTLNEADALPLLLADLAAQQGVSFEVLVADGGSTDTTCLIADEHFASAGMPGRCLIGPSGRGRQLNAGALAACADWLLFLHADSRLGDTRQLHTALEFMRNGQRTAGSDAVAGHFQLRFDAPGEKNGFGWFYYEVKASLGRPGSIHGDQGFLLAQSFFQRVGPFREDIPVMEDTSLAEGIRAAGRWLLLPGVIVTSARRFQVEGFKARQTLNALMMNFLAIGWLDFFAHTPTIYRQQDLTQPLQLFPFFRLINDLLAEMPVRRRWSLWLATGGYVRSQAWQLGLALDCRKAYHHGYSAEVQPGTWLNFFDRWFEPLTNHAIGRGVTALLVRFWFSRQLKDKVQKNM